jgi:hypothetical protein
VEASWLKATLNAGKRVKKEGEGRGMGRVIDNSYKFGDSSEDGQRVFNENEQKKKR